MPKRASIIIVSYNNWDATTGPCLESLLFDESNKQFEIIVVDNNSTDKTPDMLAKISTEHENVKIISNKINRGFAGGNNDGVDHAEGRIVILLNSDTIVPVDAVEKMCALLELNDDWAMLGPITNEAGNEQKIPVNETDIKKILVKGQLWCEHSNGDCFESPRLDFCCVAIKKGIYTALGGLDEDFGLGYYEDTDFSLKVLERKHKMMFTEEVFIYHRAGKSFSGQGRKNIARLMKANKKLLKKKHGCRVKLHHIRDCNLKIIENYVRLLEENIDNTAYCRKIQYRFQRRLRLAKKLYPNNPFKKLPYWLSIRALYRKYGGLVDG